MQQLSELRAEMSEQDRVRLDQAMEQLTQVIMDRAVRMTRKGVSDNDEIESESQNILNAVMESAESEEVLQDPQKLIEAIESAARRMGEMPEPYVKGSGF